MHVWEFDHSCYCSPSSARPTAAGITWRTLFMCPLAPFTRRYSTSLVTQMRTLDTLTEDTSCSTDTSRFEVAVLRLWLLIALLFNLQVNGWVSQCLLPVAQVYFSRLIAAKINKSLSALCDSCPYMMHLMQPRFVVCQVPPDNSHLQPTLQEVVATQFTLWSSEPRKYFICTCFISSSFKLQFPSPFKLTCIKRHRSLAMGAVMS